MKLISILAESRRLQPAIITMKRGTVIQADHARLIRYPSGRILVVGIGPGRFKATRNSHEKERNTVRALRDFWTIGQYVPTDWQDVVGWHDIGVTDTESRMIGAGNWQTDDRTGYSAHRWWSQIRKFKHILTMYPENIASIETQ